MAGRKKSAAKRTGGGSVHAYLKEHRGPRTGETPGLVTYLDEIVDRQYEAWLLARAKREAEKKAEG